MHLNNFMRKMQYSGYDKAFRYTIGGKRVQDHTRQRGERTTTNAPAKNMETSGTTNGEGGEEENVVQERWIRFCAIRPNDARRRVEEEVRGSHQKKRDTYAGCRKNRTDTEKPTAEI